MMQQIVQWDLRDHHDRGEHDEAFNPACPLCQRYQPPTDSVSAWVLKLPTSRGEVACEVCNRPIHGRVFGDPYGEKQRVCWGCYDNAEYDLAVNYRFTDYEDDDEDEY